MNKVFLTIMLGICGVVLLGTVVMMVIGEFDPVVSIKNDSINISGMYGLNVGFHEITGVTLIEDSMQNISDGQTMRTNGFDGFGQAQKGHFTSPQMGMHIRLVQSRTSPTIRIERRAFDIYLNFRDSEKTLLLYDDLIKILP